jgi:hypothetical protein
MDTTSNTTLNTGEVCSVADCDKTFTNKFCFARHAKSHAASASVGDDFIARHALPGESIYDFTARLSSSIESIQSIDDFTARLSSIGAAAGSSDN